MKMWYTDVCSTTAKTNATSALELETSPTENDQGSSSFPQIVWLASYPNSGTSYTMTMVQRATNLATATQYGAEVTVDTEEDPTPLLPQSPDGPFWDAYGKIGKNRSLPSKYIMTKTHCGGRCVKCPASEYVTNAKAFYATCERTSGFRRHQHFELSSSRAEVAKLIHLIRNPFDNIVARFHLEQKHIVEKSPHLEATIPKNATGFRKWCSELDKVFSFEDSKFFTSEQRHLMELVPCHSEFFKYAQWHRLLIEAVDLPTLVVFYEDYHYAQNVTSQKIFDFLEQEAINGLSPFRSPPVYSGHFRRSEKDTAKILLENLSSTAAWALIRRYFEDPSSNN
jgi:Sulfotransferase domain